MEARGAERGCSPRASCDGPSVSLAAAGADRPDGVGTHGGRLACWRTPGLGRAPWTSLASPQPKTTGTRNWRAVRDTCRYRHHYPDLVDGGGDDEDMPNLSFYRNETCFLPNGCLIEDFLQHWRDDYSRLEDDHSYIQWLFPLREPGVNWHAKPLTRQEVEAFKSSEEVRRRLVQAYELMLAFYGIQLQDRSTGQVCRAQNYQKRFQNLNRGALRGAPSPAGAKWRGQLRPAGWWLEGVPALSCRLLATVPGEGHSRRQAGAGREPMPCASLGAPGGH
ncbi:PREDICTED: opioid growth factor receptor [Condylura cristata]|uniref:opioid growth factor receptor n=1 Tax=Condylura cristata TaxID=143302 RepID=UPI00064325B6|nr:PREDICTED: opioid growth factor receptor [Condylura cristata]